MEALNSRRSFIKKTTSTAATSVGMLALPMGNFAPPDFQTSVDEINIVGPKNGYTPHIGTMISMMNWMRRTILYPVRGLSIAELDYIHDDNSNSIGAMLLHLAATERFYQLNTFEGRSWGDWPDKDEKEFDLAMSLGDEARRTIKGNDLEFYLDKLKSVRDYTKKEFAKRDDEWLMKADEDWGWGPTNNYCKWFHVCEHESNHNGQIKWIKSRISV